MTQNAPKAHDIKLQSIWERIAPLTGGGDLVLLDSVMPTGTKEILGQYGGINALQIVPATQQVRGVFIRDQLVDSPWDTFTMRAEYPDGRASEFSLRMKSFLSESGWIFPSLIIEAYSDSRTGEVLAVGAIRGATLLEFLGKEALSKRPTNGVQLKQARATGVRFFSIPWTALASAGQKVAVWRAQ